MFSVRLRVLAAMSEGFGETPVSLGRPTGAAAAALVSSVVGRLV